ncbi:Pimeloyl-ACP methyl ester carboxylesterase [Oceanobacillus limi]|uniref:Pimeloyl-ACP methyl ester carboxylesterase n=1 Tax=Oceanobacillus limi TaxID=930131 RepID=A0A1I0A7M5_9BACI|nr:alpha/beta hydrolase [Oceanobacillus limi]SES90196.1 Pimeloyl-ACP methyl ester carboxylesterase [Oceanobacillus limi]
MKKIDLTDATIHYDIKGCSPSSEHANTIVFLHGVGLDHTEWHYLIPYLEDSYRLFTYDLRWHGLSSGTFYSDDERNWKALFIDFISLLEKEEITNYHLVGHGIGAQLGIELISSEMVKPLSYTILSTPFYYPASVAEKGIKYRTEKIKGMTGRELGAWMIPQIMETKDPEKHEHIKNSFEKARLDLYMDIFLLQANALDLEKLKKIFIPTLLLNGEMDVNYPPELTNISMKYLPNGRAKILRNASNMVHVDQPEHTAAHILEFIQEHDVKKRNTAKNLDLPYLDMLYEKIEKSMLIRIDFLTVFQMQINGVKVEGKWNQRKARELIAYVAFFGKSTKEVVCEALWPNSNKVSAQNSLRVSIHHLRKLLKDAGYKNIIHSDMQYVWIDENIDVSCDVLEAMKEKVSLPPRHLLFSDIPSDWTMNIQSQLEVSY